MRRLSAAVYLAQKMGRQLGSSALLLGRLSHFGRQSAFQQQRLARERVIKLVIPAQAGIHGEFGSALFNRRSAAHNDGS